MTEFTSSVKTISCNQEKVYQVLSNLENLEQLKGQLPQDKIDSFTFDRDSCSFSVNPIGPVKFSIVEREPFKTIKFAGVQLPVEIYLWIQLVPSGENETKAKLTVKAELNPFIKPMVSKPLQDGINKIADVLDLIPYAEIEQ